MDKDDAILYLQNSVNGRKSSEFADKVKFYKVPVEVAEKALDELKKRPVIVCPHCGRRIDNG